MPISDEVRSNKIDYKQKYSNLKRKLKILIYENECYQEELKKAQRQLLQVSRDKSYLLDRLVQYENIQTTSSDSDDTLSSDSESEQKQKSDQKRKKTNDIQPSESQPTTSSNKKKKPPSQNTTTRSKSATSGKPTKPLTVNTSTSTLSSTMSSTLSSTMSSTMSSSSCSSSTALQTPIIKIEPDLTPTCSKPLNKSKTNINIMTKPGSSTSLPSNSQDGHMTSEELERHLESRRHQVAMLMPEKTPLTLPVELFSNESSNGLPDN